VTNPASETRSTAADGTRRVWYAAGAAGIALAAVAILLTPLVIDRVAEHRLREARSRANQGDWEQAAALAASAFNLNPNGLEAARLGIRLGSSLKRGPSGFLATRLFDHPDALPADRVLALQADLARSDLPAFRSKLATMSRAERDSPGIVDVEIAALTAEGKGDRAIELARERYRLSKSDESALRLARTLALFKPASAHEVAELIRPLIQSKGPLLEDALALLNQIPAEAVATIPLDRDIYKVLAERDRKDPETWIGVYELERVHDPKRVGALVDRAVSWGGATPPKPLLEWLLRIGQPEVIVEILDQMGPEKARKNYGMLPIRAALLAGDSVRAAEEIEANLAVPLVQRALLRAVIAEESGNPEQVEAWWLAAVRAASIATDPEASLLMAEASIAANREDIWAISVALGTKKDAGRFTREQVLEASGILAELGEIKQLREATKSWLSRFPEDPDFLNNLAYLDLLGGENHPQALATAKLLLEAHPEHTAYRTTLALAHLRNRNPSRTLEIIGEPDSPLEVALTAAALSDLGRTEEARKLTSGLLPESLLPIERWLLSR